VGRDSSGLSATGSSPRRNGEHFPHASCFLEGEIACHRSRIRFSRRPITAEPPPKGLSAYGLVWAGWLYSRSGGARNYGARHTVRHDYEHVLDASAPEFFFF